MAHGFLLQKSSQTLNWISINLLPIIVVPAESALMFAQHQQSSHLMNLMQGNVFPT